MGNRANLEKVAWTRLRTPFLVIPPILVALSLMLHGMHYAGTTACPGP